MIGFIQQLQRRTPLGWLQLSRERSRLLVALSGIAFADVLMFLQLGFQAALYDSNTRLSSALQTDIVLLSPKARSTQNLSTFSRRRLYQAMDIEGVESAEPFYSNTVTWKNPQTRKETTIQVIGFDPDQPALDLPEVNQQLEKIKLPDTVLFDRGSRGEYKEAIAQIERGGESHHRNRAAHDYTGWAVHFGRFVWSRWAADHQRSEFPVFVSASRSR